MGAFAERVTVKLPFVVNPQTFLSLIDMEAIAARKKALQPTEDRRGADSAAQSRELRDQLQRMEESMKKLREDVMASGQVTKPMPSFAPAAFAMHRGQELIGAISRKKIAKVWRILQDPANADIKEQIATHCAYNGMTPLHHACRVMCPGWMKELMLWAPQVVNWPTYEGGGHAEPLDALAVYARQPCDRALYAGVV